MNFQISPSQKNLWFPYVIAAVVVSAIIVFFSSLILWHEQKEYERQASVAVQNTAALVSNQITGIFDEAETLLQAVDFTYRSTVASGKFDPQIFSAFLNESLTWTPSFGSVGFIDADGIYLYDSGNFKPFSLADRDYFLKLRDRPKGAENSSTYYSDPIFTKQSNRWVIVIARRVESPDGRFAGVVLVRWDISRLTESLKSLNLPKGDSIALLTENLTRVSRYPFDRKTEALIGTRNVSKEFADAIKTSAVEGTFRAASSMDQVESYFAYSKTQNAPFYVLVRIPLKLDTHSTAN